MSVVDRRPLMEPQQKHDVYGTGEEAILSIREDERRCWMLTGRARPADASLSNKILRIQPRDVNRGKPIRETIWLLDDIVGATIHKNPSRRLVSRGLPEGVNVTVMSVVSYPQIPAYCACCVRGPNRASAGPEAGVPSRAQARARRELRMAFADREEAEQWYRAINRLARSLPVRDEDGAILPLPRRRLMCVINPVGGPGRARSLFRRIWRRILEDAEVDVTEVITEYAGHGRDIASAIKLDDYEGLVAVGGDGMLHELIQGLLHRPDWDEARLLPLGHLPGGSGNGVSRSVVEAANEVADWVAPAFLIAKGGVTPWDCSLVVKEDVEVEYTPHGEKEAMRIPQRFFSVLTACSWGIVSDLDIESERCRCCGDFRYTVQGLVRALCLRWYNGRFSFLRATAGGPEAAGAITSREESKDGGGGGRGEGGEGKEEDGSNFFVGPGPQPRLMRPLSDPVPDDWETREGVFTMLWVNQTTHQSKDVFGAPDARFDDGVMYAVVAKETNIMSMVRILLGLEDGSYLDTSAMETIPVRAFRMEPEPAPWGGFVSVDGEQVAYGPVQGEVFQGFLRLITGRRNLGIGAFPLEETDWEGDGEEGEGGGGGGDEEIGLGAGTGLVPAASRQQDAPLLGEDDGKED